MVFFFVLVDADVDPEELEEMIEMDNPQIFTQGVISVRCDLKFAYVVP